MTLTTRALALVAGLLLGAVGLAVAQPVPVTVPTAGGDVTVLADRIEDLGRDDVVVATGNVEVVRGRARLNADRVEINRETGDAVATGRVVFYDGEDRLTGDRIDYNIKTGTGVVHHGRASTAPYYRAVNESQDLTVAFDAYEMKGFGGRVQYRYRLSEDAGGTFNGFYVHESKVNDDDRGWVHFQHEWRGPAGWRAVADVNMVSD